MDAIPPEVPIDERNEPRLKTSTPADKVVLFVQVTYGHMHYPVSQAPPFHPMVLIEQMIEVSGRGAAPHTVDEPLSFFFFDRVPAVLEQALGPAEYARHARLQARHHSMSLQNSAVIASCSSLSQRLSDSFRQ